MKIFFNKLTFLCSVALSIMISGHQVLAQEDSSNVEKVIRKPKPVKNTFGSVWLMDHQTVMVPIKGTLEMDIQHRFGKVNNGSKDLFGFFAPSNIRLAMSYSPIKNLFIGTGVTKERYIVDLNAKYAILQQTPEKSPISVSVFGNVGIDARGKSLFRFPEHRLAYFSQLLIAKKVNESFSVQVAPSCAWFNNVEGYISTNGDIKKKTKNSHLSISGLGRLKVSEKGAVMLALDQPLTKHTTNNPHPNVSFGYEVTTSSHAFQVFFGNAYGIVPQYAQMYNQNDFTKGEFLIGFNITRLWNF